MKRICSFFFLALLSVLLLGTALFSAKTEILKVVQGYGGGIRGIVLTVMDHGTVEKVLTENVFLHNYWIDLYGGSMRVVGTDFLHEEENKSICRTNSGAVTFLCEDREMPDQAMEDSIRALKETCEHIGADAWFIQIPQKNCTQESDFSCRGIHDYSEDIGTARAALFSECGFSVLDLHSAMHAQNLSHQDAYFRTDHHWKGTTGLWVSGEIAEALKLQTDHLFTSPDRFAVKIFPKILLGSEGRHLGRLYCPPEDLDIPIPLYETDYTIDIPENSFHADESIEETLFFFDYLQNDAHYRLDPYHVFLDGNHQLLTIQNNRNPNGPHILFIRDSFVNSVAPYLAAACGKITLFDPRFSSPSVIPLILRERPDHVCVALYPKTENAYFLFQ